MKINFWKYLKILLIIISLIFSIFNICSSFKKGTINLLAITSLAPILVALYTEIDFIYIMINKIKAFCSQKTVSFTPKFYFLSDRYTSIHDVNEKLLNNLQKMKYSIDKTSSKGVTEDTINYNISNKEGLKSLLSIQLIPSQNDNWQIVLKIDYQVSYRDVRNSWNKFLDMKRKIIDSFSNTKDSKSHYAITIDTNNASFNPFYRLTVRNFDRIEVTNFELTFKTDNLEVKPLPHKIYCVSSNENDIDKVIKEYIPLSKVI